VHLGIKLGYLDSQEWFRIPLFDMRLAVLFLGACTKFRKATSSFNLSVCPSTRPPVRMVQLSSNWTEFRDNWYSSIFLKSVEKIQVSLQSDKNNGYFTRRTIYIYYHISLSSSQNAKMFQTKIVEKIKTHILCSIKFFENRAIYEIMWKDTVEPGRSQMAIWCM